MDFSDLKGMFGEVKGRMDAALDRVRREMAHVRTGRATVGLLDNIQVDAYGTRMPINQVATLSVPEPAMIIAQPFDPSVMGAIEKAIRASDLGLNPNNDGKLIRIPIPPLTEERRKDLVKHLHVVTEEHRVALRNIRRDSNEAVKKLLKEKAISEDEERRAHDDIQKLTDGYIQKADQASKTKEKEVLEL